MVTIGNDTLPGTITTVESAPSVGGSLGSAGTPVILGQADLSNGTASANSAERVTRSKQAADLFGAAEDSELTKNVQDALVEGANPVFAIAPEEKSVTGEDLSGESGQTATLANAPVIEDASKVNFTVNSTSKDTVLYYDDDPGNATPGTDEVYLNPVTGKFKVDESLGNTGDSVDYDWADWSNTFDEVSNYQINNNTFLRDVVDFVAPLSEKDSVVNSGRDKVDSMEQNGSFAILLAGAGDPYISDTGSFSNNYDNSRVQLIYPSRNSDGRSVIGGYTGRRAAVGIDSSPIFSRVQTATSLQFNLSVTQQENLVTSHVNPLGERSGGARIIDDTTTVSDSNSDESAWRQGLSRLITDFVAEEVRDEANDYVGEFNNAGVLNTMRGNIASVLTTMLDSNQLEAYSLVVERVDNTTASVDVGIDTADPLRNIELTISAGNVQNGVEVEV